MMNNLFSIFDPSTNSLIDLNWISSLLSFLSFPMMYWLFSSRYLFLFYSLNLTLYKEFKIILFNKFNSPNIIFFITLMLLILINNFMGLFPYIFTSSSHLIFSLSISLPLWLGLMTWGWLNNTNFMFSHLIPRNTPLILMPFMVMIETTSNIIRPGTLSIRLTANMIAGHLLLTLMSQSTLSLNIFFCMMIIFSQIILLTLEFSVSIIQAYVFSILSTLYTKETN